MSLVSARRAAQSFGVGQVGACLDWPFQLPRPCITWGREMPQSCHLSSLLYPEEGVYIISECLPSPVGVDGQQYTAEGGLSLHAIPPKHVGRRVVGWTKLVSQMTWSSAIKKKKSAAKKGGKNCLDIKLSMPLLILKILNIGKCIHL